MLKLFDTLYEYFGSEDCFSSHILTICSPSTFNKVIDGSKAALIEFYAPWCGHCKRLTPEYKKLGEAIATNPKLNSRVVIAKVDADQHRELGERFQVQGFPTSKSFFYSCLIIFLYCLS
jgi:protein disulfide-isomerase-like protein